ncbi:MAG: hypothetical protein IJQ55_04035 [Alphaproteobacteria bacterium]|nr:hypothetical protein [Alphaproteobacteria bacterium]
MTEQKNKDTNSFEFVIENIIDSCFDILKKNNIIVYPSDQETHNGTIFNIKQMDADNKVGESIFTVYGPNHGYGLKIIKADITISGYYRSPDNATKLRKLWTESDIKSSKQKKLREEIANKKLMSSLMATQYYLQNLVNKIK